MHKKPKEDQTTSQQKNINSLFLDNLLQPNNGTDIFCSPVAASHVHAKKNMPTPEVNLKERVVCRGSQCTYCVFFHLNEGNAFQPPHKC